MSLLIKGMKMPESCIQCFAQMGGWCYVAPPEIDEKVAATVEKAAEQGRPEWCPLIELPSIETKSPEILQSDLASIVGTEAAEKMLAQAAKVGEAVGELISQFLEAVND